MKKLVLLVFVFQLAIFSLQAQTNSAETEQLIKVNQDLIVNYKAGKFDNALNAAQKAVELSNKIYGAESLQLATSYKNVGIIYRAKKKYKESIVNLQKAIEIYNLKPEQNSKALAQILDELALTFALDGDVKKTEETYTMALATAEKAYGKESKEILPFLKAMTDVYILVKKYDEAQEMFVRHYLTAGKYYLPDSKELQEIKDDFYCFNSRSFKSEESIERQKKFFEAIRSNQNNSVNPNGNKSVDGGIINGKAKYLALPSYPSSARYTGAQGVIPVRVRINEEGKVIEAKAICGDTNLRTASEDAARKSTFEPTILKGKAIQITGIIVYNFVR